MNRWYPKSVGRAARYLRRNTRPQCGYPNSELFWRRLICQIRLDHARERGIVHHYNSSNGDFLKG